MAQSTTAAAASCVSISCHLFEHWPSAAHVKTLSKFSLERKLSLIAMPLSGQSAKTTMKVLSLNTWGLNWPFSEDKWYRVRALRNIIALGDYDVILLQEVWFRRDYDIIRSAVPYASYFESFNQCSGYFLPMECSGLVILSRHKIEHVEFLPFRDGRTGKAAVRATFLSSHLFYTGFTIRS